MQLHNIGTAILSITSPGTTVLEGDSKAASVLSRHINKSAASLCAERPTTFGFFATLPPLVSDHLDVVLGEVAFAFDELNADGVTLFTRYGQHYLGHLGFRPLWDELDRRGAVVFIHPTHSLSHDMVNPALPQPVIDYPHETTRTAVDLIVSNTIKDHPNVKIILSHAGGTLPFLATRAAHLSADAGFSSVQPDDFLEQARSFYFDLALSSNPLTLDLLREFAKPDHILYGSDFPYAPTSTIEKHVRMLDDYRKMDGASDYSVARGAAVRLFPRFDNPTNKIPTA